MRLSVPISLALVPALLLSAAAVSASRGDQSARAVPLKDAKLNIEHNATDEDTGFQGFVDSEGWRRLDVRGPAVRCSRSKDAASSQSSG